MAGMKNVAGAGSGAGAGASPQQVAQGLQMSGVDALTANRIARHGPAGMPAEIQQAFSHDFSNVRVHQGLEPGMNQAIQAQAYSSSTHIAFAPGNYNPSATAGQELLGHELTHVVQQRAGR